MYVLFIYFIFIPANSNIKIHFDIYLFPKLQNILFYVCLHNCDSKNIIIEYFFDDISTINKRIKRVQFTLLINVYSHYSSRKEDQSL